MDPQLQSLQSEISTEISRFSRERLNFHLQGKWSAAEILEHLYLTYTGTLKGFDRVIEAGKPLATAQNWKQRGRAFVVVRLRYLPAGREAPPVARPRGLPQEKVLTEIAAKIGEMDARITACEQKLGSTRKLLDHPVLGPLTGAEWRKFHVVHGRHHLKQIRHLRESET